MPSGRAMAAWLDLAGHERRPPLDDLAQQLSHLDCLGFLRPLRLAPTGGLHRSFSHSAV